MTAGQAAGFQSDVEAGGNATRILVVVGAATLLVLAVYTTVITTAGQTALAFGASAAWQTWALGGMSLGLAAALLPSGALADRLGRRRVFTVSSLGLAATSALGAAAPSISVFVAARVLEGVAGAGVLAAGLGLIGHAFPSGQARTHATGIWGAMLAAGIAIGPVLGAGLADAAGWRSAYWADALGAAVLAAACRKLPATHEEIQGQRLDPPGAVAMLAGITAVTAGLISGRSGWTSPVTLVLLGAGVAALAAFAWIETVRTEPMLDLGLLRRPLFLTSVGGAAVTGLSTIALMNYLPTMLERGLRQEPLAAAGVIAFWSLTSMAAAMQARRLPTRIDARKRLVIGLTATGLGLVALAVLSAGSPWSRLAPGLVIAGGGSGLVNAALGRLAVESVPHANAGLGSGANNTARYVGAAFGIAMVVAIVASGGSGHAGLVRGWNWAALAAAILNLVGAGLILALRPSVHSSEPEDGSLEPIPQPGGRAS